MGPGDFPTLAEQAFNDGLGTEKLVKKLRGRVDELEQKVSALMLFTGLVWIGPIVVVDSDKEKA